MITSSASETITPLGAIVFPRGQARRVAFGTCRARKNMARSEARFRVYAVLSMAPAGFAVPGSPFPLPMPPDCESGRHHHRCPEGRQQCDHHCDDRDKGRSSRIRQGPLRRRFHGVARNREGQKQCRRGFSRATLISSMWMAIFGARPSSGARRAAGRGWRLNRLGLPCYPWGPPWAPRPLLSSSWALSPDRRYARLPCR
jgi:hypothetical protein